MAYELRITDGTNVLFTMSDRVNSVVMPVATAVPSTGAAGAENIDDYLEVGLLGGRVTAVGNARLLAKLLREAARYEDERVGIRLYLEKLNQAEATEVWMRTPLLGGSVLDDPDMLLRSGKMLCRVAIRRKNYWEAAAETQIPVSNTNVSNNTSGITLWNCSDNSGSIPNRRVNWFSMAAAAVAGDLPAPARLELTNSFNSASRIGTVWVAHNVHADPDNFTHIIEGETSTIGTDTNSSAASGGQYCTGSWSGAGETRLFAWDLSTDFLNRCKGNVMRILARFATAPAQNIFARLRVRASLSTIYESGPLLLKPVMMQELPALRLPPYLIREGNIYPLTLELLGQSDTTSNSLAVDFLQVSPTDSWRMLEPFGFNLAYQARLIDDGINDEIYSDSWATPGKFGNYVGKGSPLLLVPGKVQRVYVLQSNDTAGGAITQTMSAKIHYRPRWRSL